MPFLQYLPSETLEDVFFHIETPKDLLNIALTCKYLCDLIIPTYRLHFASIGCSVSETSSTFWQTLSTTPRFCSMIRHIELCDSYLLPRVSPIRQLLVVPMDEQFVTKWAGSKPQLPLTDRSNFQDFFHCLAPLNNCQSITLFESFSEDEYKDIFTFITVNLSENLQNLVIKRFGRHRVEEGEYVRRYTFPPNMTCSFDRLTTFYIDLDIYEYDFLIPPIERMLDSSISSCSTLVTFALMLTCWVAPFIYPALLSHANWPSLKKLKLKGIELFTKKRGARDIYISFLKRHLQIECLHLENLNGDDDFEQILQCRPPPHVLPHLRSLHSNFPLHSDILPRLYHISYLNVFSPAKYPLARSLRSCTLFTASIDVIDPVIRAFPQLERLWVYLRWCHSDCAPDPCGCIFKLNLPALSELQNLTHLGFFAFNVDMETMANLIKYLLSRLPLLSYVYLFNGRPVQYEVIRDPATGFGHLRPSKQPYQTPDGIELEDIFDVMIKNRLLY